MPTRHPPLAEPQAGTLPCPQTTPVGAGPLFRAKEAALAGSRKAPQRLYGEATGWFSQTVTVCCFKTTDLRLSGVKGHLAHEPACENRGGQRGDQFKMKQEPQPPRPPEGTGFKGQAFEMPALGAEGEWHA